MNKNEEKLYRIAVKSATQLLDASLGLIKAGNISYEDLSEVISEIKAEMNMELDNISENKKLLRNYARGRLATCEDLLIRIKNKIDKK